LGLQKRPQNDEAPRHLGIRRTSETEGRTNCLREISTDAVSNRPKLVRMRAYLTALNDVEHNLPVTSLPRSSDELNQLWVIALRWTKRGGGKSRPRSVGGRSGVLFRTGGEVGSLPIRRHPCLSGACFGCTDQAAGSSSLSASAAAAVACTLPGL